MNELIEAKEKLTNYMIGLIDPIDVDSIEYLVDTLDYLILEKIPHTNEILDVIIEDIIVTYTQHKQSVLLKVASLITKYKKGNKLCMK